MSTPITVRVIAMSDQGFFIAAHNDGYCIFSLANPTKVELGDRLWCDVHGHSAATIRASNQTRQDELSIDLVDWETSLDGAISHLLKLGSPQYVHAGSKRIATNSENVIIQLQEEILRLKP